MVQHRPDTVVILAAGQGTRMKSQRAKVLHPLCGRPMLAWVVDQALALEPERIVVVVGHAADEVSAALSEGGFGDRVRCVVQEPQLGTGHALQVCLPVLGPDPGRVVVLYGDMPLLTPESLERLCEAQAETATEGEPGAAILTARPLDPRGFGRIIRRPFGDPSGDIVGIIEERDASAEIRAVDEVNLGVYAFPGAELVRMLPELKNNNAQGEFYLTDVVSKLVAAKRRVVGVELEDEEEAIGVNNLAHLAEARQEVQWRILQRHMENGVQIEDPGSTYIDHGVEIGVGTRILPCTVIRSGVVIGADCEVGPFTHLRVGAVLEGGAEVGNFTEMKKSVLGAHSKAKHLSYLGDAQIGARVNIGAGTIFANYDGVHKHTCRVGDGSFIGSGTVLVAPTDVGEKARTGAGAIVTGRSQVPAGETWVGIPARPLPKKAPNP